ncbi:hypothetical protein GKE82_23890 [Conexibacter sp. W3-3-2]|uniref:CHAP domain-containing protein n=1 Tax=Conexibacter sp. W3-3-2 TaxID=2675227 RepID=UPI0012B8F7C3|nr:CHAP domain-containing protein [Conexibacter sp. W3-3-2]MTD47249.1 hypothetical protein [Conexibacter sp. W3-3-2]
MSAAPAHSALAAAQGQSLLDRQRDLVVRLKGDVDRRGAQSARYAQRAAVLAAAQDELATARRQQRQIVSVLREARRSRQQRRERDQRKASALLEQLLGSDADFALPSLSAAVGSGPTTIVRAAQAELARNVVEAPLGSNNSPDIARYRSATRNAAPGQPWCAYFVSYLARRAGKPLGPGGEGMGYVPAIRTWAGSLGRWAPSDAITPVPGDLIVFPQHIGLVTGYDPSTKVVTSIEGNTSHRVAERTHQIQAVLGFVRLWGAPLAQPGPVAMPKWGTGRYDGEQRYQGSDNDQRDDSLPSTEPTT